MGVVTFERADIVERDDLRPDDFVKIAFAGEFGTVDQDEIEDGDAIVLFDTPDACAVGAGFGNVAEVPFPPLQHLREFLRRPCPPEAVAARNPMEVFDFLR